MSAVDPTKQPIAALLQEWRDRAFAQPHNSTLDGLCDELEAAIKAQCEAWEERTRELAAERERLNAIAYGESERAEELEAELAKLREEREYRCWPENMPPLMGPYLVMRAGGGQAVAFLQWGEWYWRPGKRLTDVTHWTHLPAPPGEKGDP